MRLSSPDGGLSARLLETLCAADRTRGQPGWTKAAAKLLEAGKEGEDWRALGELLGYKQSKLEEFEVLYICGYAPLLYYVVEVG